MIRDETYLLDIVQSAKLAIDYVREKTLVDFLKDTVFQDAVIRRFEIIGEAARRISKETKEEYPSIPWKTIIGMRNILIHEYDDINFPAVWKTVKEDLPPLITALEKIVTPREQ